jgi:hypothetical protein
MALQESLETQEILDHKVKMDHKAAEDLQVFLDQLEVMVLMVTLVRKERLERLVFPETKERLA